MMFDPRFATILSITLLFLLSALLPRNARADDIIPTSFTKLEGPLLLPAALLYSLDDQQIPLAELIKDLHGATPVYLHLWSPACPPCVAEMKDLNKALPALKESGVRLILVTEDADGRVTTGAFLRRYGLNALKPVIDPGRIVERALKPKGIPATYALSARGEAIAVHLGAVDWAAMASAR